MLSSVLLTITYITLTLSHPHEGKIHQCSSHKQHIIKGVNLHQINVPYYNHPYANPIKSTSTDPHSRRRSLLIQSETAPIRIRAYYDPLTVNTNSLSTDQIQNLKSTIGAIVNYYQQMVQVIPINGTFFLDQKCTYGAQSVYGIDCLTYASTPYQCKNVQIPNDHLGTAYLFNGTTEAVTRLGPGRGISDADLILYISADDTTSSCSGSALAHAGPCIVDQYGRPIAGNINICASFFSDHEWKKDIETMLHELSHITIMLSGLWDNFRDSNGIERPIEDVFDTTKLELKTPLLLQTVRDHFNCSSATGLPVQNGSLSHWSERHVFSENMNPTIYTQQMFYSKFTLALMEDSGWYVPNYEYAEPYYFGKDAGCGWFTDDCINKNTHVSNFPAWYCDSAFDDGCNQDNSAPGKCFYYNYNIPTQFQYFTNPSKGGSPSSDYCPWRDPGVVTSPDYESVCWDIRGNSDAFDTAYMAEKWGSKSKCTKIVATNGETDAGYCFEHECLNWDATLKQYDGVNIIFSNSETITCHRADALTTVPLSSVSSRELTCPDIDIVCGKNTHFDMCYWGHYSDIEGKCICNPGYTGIDCNTIDDAMNVEVVLGPVLGEPTWDMVVCIKGFTRYPNYNGQWTYVEIYDYLPVYYRANEATYLWWHYWDHTWYMSTAIGSNNNICRCKVSYFTKDLSLCNDHWRCGSKDQTGSSSSYGICVNTPTSSPSTKEPTLAPTKYPTLSPTNNPIPSPTGNPIPSPTLNPSKNPTNNPSINPTNNPSINPTINPTHNPTTATPTNNPSINPTKHPSLSPSISPTGRILPQGLFRKDIVITFQYEIDEDGECDNSVNTTNIVGIIEIFTNEWVGELKVSIDIITLTNDEENEKFSIEYIASARSEASLEELESIINSRKFKKKLIDRLEDIEDCFKFLDIFVTTNSGGNMYVDDGINILNFENYGTTEILTLILIGLILFACIWVCIWVAIKCKQRKREKRKANTIEFGGAGITRRISKNKEADELFEQALTITHQRKYSNKSAVGISHIVQATPSDIPLPYNTNNDYVASGDEGFDI